MVYFFVRHLLVVRYFCFLELWLFKWILRSKRGIYQKLLFYKVFCYFYDYKLSPFPKKSTQNTVAFILLTGFAHFCCNNQ